MGPTIRVRGRAERATGANTPPVYGPPGFATGGTFASELTCKVIAAKPFEGLVSSSSPKPNPWFESRSCQPLPLAS